MASGQDLLNDGSRLVGKTTYSVGAHIVDPKNNNPASTDCSGFVLWLTKRAGVSYAGTSNAQLAQSKAAGLEISLDQARNTPGALLFKVGEGPAGHVAISVGNGKDTLETNSSGGGTTLVKGGALRTYYTKAGLIPGIDYGQANQTAVIDPAAAATAVAQPPQKTAMDKAVSIADLLQNNSTAPSTTDITAVREGDTHQTIAQLMGKQGTTDAPADPAVAAYLHSIANQGAVAPTGGASAWASALLARLTQATGKQYQATPQNLAALDAWQRAEGGGNMQRNNPFNTTQSYTGASVTVTGAAKKAGVKTYASLDDGLSATVQTLTNGKYGGILDALAKGSDSYAVADAVGSSPWGTNGTLMKNVLKGH